MDKQDLLIIFGFIRLTPSRGYPSREFLILVEYSVFFMAKARKIGVKIGVNIAVSLMEFRPLFDDSGRGLDCALPELV
jgi:hypothetical protein